MRPAWRDDRTIDAVSSFLVLQTLVEGDTAVLAAGQYHDAIVCDSGSLRFQSKRCVYDTTMLPNTVVYPL